MRLGVLLAGLLVGSGTLVAQMGSLDAPAPKPKQYVTFAAEPQTLKTGAKSVVELHFRVMDGFHVKSHTPKSEFLIPPQVTFKPADGVKVGAVEYPPGTTYSFSFDPS